MSVKGSGVMETAFQSIPCAARGHDNRGIDDRLHNGKEGSRYDKHQLCQPKSHALET